MATVLILYYSRSGNTKRMAEAGGHYGPVSIGALDNRAIRQCRALGERVAVLAKRLAMSAPKSETR